VQIFVTRLPNNSEGLEITNHQFASYVYDAIIKMNVSLPTSCM
jgi:hypothetical protein